MDKCKLCKVNDLSGIKSHIFTESLIRSALNLDGKPKRGGNEAVAQLSLKNIGYSYFGENVLPERREELLGFLQGENEILETSKNEFINDKLLCSYCEKRFGIIESEFISQIYSKLISANPNIGYSNYHTEQANLIILFFLINIWRASTSKFNKWSLSPIEAENIRILLDNSIDDEYGKVIQKFQKNKSYICNLSYVICFLEHLDQPFTENIIAIDLIENPHYFHLNRMIILFTFESNQLDLPEYLINSVHINDFEGNICEIDNINIKNLSNGERGKLVKSYLNRFSEKLFKHTAETFRDGFVNFFGYYPTNQHYNLLDSEIRNYLISGGALNIKAMMECMARTMRKIVNSRYSH